MMLCLIESKDNLMHILPYVVYVSLVENLCFRKQSGKSMGVMFEAHDVVGQVMCEENFLLRRVG
jgi:hypothetical protein